MILKKYLVNSIEEAEEQIHRDLGPNAVILTMRQLKYKGLKNLFFSNNMEVVAAVDENDLRLFQEDKKPGSSIAIEIPATPGIQAEAEKSVEEQPQPARNEPDLKKISAEKESEITREWESPRQTIKEPDVVMDNEQANAGLEEPAQYETSNIPGTYLDPRFNRKQTSGQFEMEPEMKTKTENKEYIVESAQARSSPKNEHSPANSKSKQPAMETTIENFERVSKALMEQFAFALIEKDAKFKTNSIKEEILQEIKEGDGLRDQDSQKKQKILQTLVVKGIADSHAKIILKGLELRYGMAKLLKEEPDPSLTVYLRKEISNFINTSGPILIAKGMPTIVAFAGPPGGGKTSSLAKIANQYLEGLEKKVAAIGFNLEQIGVKDHLKALCFKLSLPLAFARNKEELEAALESFKEYDLILIDTPGLNRSNKAAIEELSKHLQDIENLQIHLALNASIKDSDALAFINAFKTLMPHALIMTRTDETDTLGTLLNICQESGLPISYLSMGPRITTDLQIADPNTIAKMIL